MTLARPSLVALGSFFVLAATAFPGVARADDPIYDLVGKTVTPGAAVGEAIAGAAAAPCVP